MPLETTATFIDSLNEAWPDFEAGDTLDSIDNHMRLIKAAIRRTFPNVAGAVTPSDVEFDYLVGVNQNVQTQFGNLREGSATAVAALTAAYANSASYASQAGTASYALEVGNIGRVYYQARTSDLTSGPVYDTVNTYAEKASELTLTASGLYRLRGLLLGTRYFAGLPVGTVTDTYVLIDAYAQTTGDAGTSATAVIASGQSLHGTSISASVEARQILMRAGPATDGLAGSWRTRMHNANPESFTVKFDGLVNIDNSSAKYRVQTYMAHKLFRGLGGVSLVSSTIIIRKGSLLWAQRIGDSIPGFG